MSLQLCQYSGRRLLDRKVRIKLNSQARLGKKYIQLFKYSDCIMTDNQVIVSPVNAAHT